jgi:hypothetical protein
VVQHSPLLVPGRSFFARPTDRIGKCSLEKSVLLPSHGLGGICWANAWPRVMQPPKHMIIHKLRACRRCEDSYQRTPSWSVTKRLVPTIPGFLPSRIGPCWASVCRMLPSCPRSLPFHLSSTRLLPPLPSPRGIIPAMMPENRQSRINKNASFQS